MLSYKKFLKILERIDSNAFFTQAKYKGTRSHSMKLLKPQFEAELIKHAFSERIIDDWNSLTENIVTSKSLDIFKERLNKHWSTEWYKLSIELNSMK